MQQQRSRRYPAQTRSGTNELSSRPREILHSGRSPGWDRGNLHRAKVLGQLIEADRIMLETENEMRQIIAVFWPECR